MMNATQKAAATQKISARVLILIASGLTPLDALRQVCGTENVDAMIDTLYDKLRAMGGQ